MEQLIDKYGHHWATAIVPNSEFLRHYIYSKYLWVWDCSLGLLDNSELWLPFKIQLFAMCLTWSSYAELAKHRLLCHPFYFQNLRTLGTVLVVYGTILTLKYITVVKYIHHSTLWVNIHIQYRDEFQCSWQLMSPTAIYIRDKRSIRHIVMNS